MGWLCVFLCGSPDFPNTLKTPEAVRKSACCMGNPLLQVPPFQGGTDFSQLVPPACRGNLKEGVPAPTWLLP